MTLFFELIQVVCGNREGLSRVPTAAEWMSLFQMSQKQALVGVCFYSIQCLPKEQLAYLPIPLKMEWLGCSVKIQQQNELMDRRAREVTALFEEGGFKTCVLKGQGMARYYELRDKGVEHGEEAMGLMRQSGDIDLWVAPAENAGRDCRERVIVFMKSKGWKMGRTVVHHTDVEIFTDAKVEVHYFPSYTFSPLRWRKYRKWFKAQEKELLQQKDNILGFCYPSTEFNLVYCLLHIFRHVFHEGIGLRQLMDYYMVLIAAGRGGTKDCQQQAMRTLAWLGLSRFTAAVMYVEQVVLGLSGGNMLCKPDKEAGRYLLDEIMRSGNFGWYDMRLQEVHSGGNVRLYLHHVGRLMTMIEYYPSEVLWAPFWKVGHWLWRKMKGY